MSLTFGIPYRRVVYLSNSIEHAIELQSKSCHMYFVALPSHIRWHEVQSKSHLLRFPNLCASFHMSLRPLDVLRYTNCDKLLLGNYLIHFASNKKSVEFHEIVEVMEPTHFME